MRSRHHSKQLGTALANGSRAAGGSVLPFIAFSMAVVVACVAFSVDITRNIVAVRKLEFAADAAGLYAYSRGVSADGTYTTATANSNMAAALADPNGVTTSAWNEAPSGPQNMQGSWTSAVTIDGADVSFVQNPADQQETFLRLTARRQGTDALKQFFMPAIRAFDALGSQSGSSAPTTVEPYRTTEIIGQPACRIGAGAPRGGQTTSALAGFASFPLAISNVQFQQASSPTATNKNYVIDLVSSQNLTASAQPLHIQAAFINLGTSGGSLSYYGSAQGNQAIDQLISLFKYFYPQPDGGGTSPQTVERGVSIPAFDSADAVFATRKQALISALKPLQTAPARTLILPVVERAPQAFPATLKVVGFARMSVVQLLNAAGDDFAITLKIEDSIALPNATCANNLVTIPQLTGTTLPPAVYPFVNRSYQSSNNSLSVRPRGVVLAPALSPRDLKAS